LAQHDRSTQVDPRMRVRRTSAAGRLARASPRDYPDGGIACATGGASHTMIRDLLLSFVSLLPQSPTGAADEAKARADLAEAARHVDDLLLHAGRARDRARTALELARATEATANQVDRARLAKLAGDLGAQLASLDVTIDTHTQAITALRTAITAELPPPAAGSAAWYRDRMRAARKLPSFDETVKVLRAIELELVAAAKGKQELAALLGHVRYLLGDAIRETGLDARSTDDRARTVMLLRDASKKFDEVLGSPDAGDTGEGSSLHAAALRRRVEIEGALYLACRTMQQTSAAEAARTHRQNAERAFEKLRRNFAEATLPSGERVLDATRASVDRMREAR
jgi:hypothetical protein